MRCWDGDSLKEIDLEEIPFPSSQPKLWWKWEVQIAGAIFVSACDGSLLSYCLSLCEKDLSPVQLQCDLKCALVVSLYLEPIMGLFRPFIDLHAQCNFSRCFWLRLYILSFVLLWHTVEYIVSGCTWSSKLFYLNCSSLVWYNVKNLSAASKERWRFCLMS